MFLGIELGSTRIKAVIIGGDGTVIASGAFAWENKPLPGNVWTYDLADARAGLAAAYAACADGYAAKHGARPTRFDAIGVSAMMHGYLVFGRDGRQLAPFRTWRSTNAARAGAALSEAFGAHLPNRWPVAQLYQSILDGEPHVADIARQTTLAGYIHHLLTGQFVLGLNDASGMFPLGRALPATAGGGGGCGDAHAGRCASPGSVGDARVWNPAVSAGGRRGNRPCGDEGHVSRHGERVRRHERVRHGRP